MRDEYDFSKGVRGKHLKGADQNQTLLSIRIDTDILDWLRMRVNQAGGGNYQRMINRILRDAMNDKPPTNNNKVV